MKLFPFHGKNRNSGKIGKSPFHSSNSIHESHKLIIWHDSLNCFFSLSPANFSRSIDRGQWANLFVYLYKIYFTLGNSQIGLIIRNDRIIRLRSDHDRLNYRFSCYPDTTRRGKYFSIPQLTAIIARQFLPDFHRVDDYPSREKKRDKRD